MTPLNAVCNRRSVLSLLILGLLTTLVIFASSEFQGRNSLLALQDGGAETKGGDAQIEEVMDELAEEYDGTVLVAEDLMTLVIGKNVSVVPFNHGASGARHKPLRA